MQTQTQKYKQVQAKINAITITQAHYYIFLSKQIFNTDEKHIQNITHKKQQKNTQSIYIH